MRAPLWLERAELTANVLAEYLSATIQSCQKSHYGNSKNLSALYIHLEVNTLLPGHEVNIVCCSCQRVESFECLHGCFCHLCGDALFLVLLWNALCILHLSGQNAGTQSKDSARVVKGRCAENWKGQKSVLKMKQWKESNLLRKPISIICVGTQVEWKHWDLFSQAVGICGRDHFFQGQLQAWNTGELFADRLEWEDVLTEFITRLSGYWVHWTDLAFGRKSWVVSSRSLFHIFSNLPLNILNERVFTSLE